MTSGAAAAGSSRGRRAPRLLVAAAALVALGAVAPVAYLTLRALSADGDARALTPFSTTLELAWDTAILALGVVVATLVVGVPLAWLVVRTDLPGRRLWGLAASLPLVIPSFVAALALLGAFAPRGLVQEALEPIGVERLPEVTGYWGALVALTLSTYPYVYLLTAAGLRSVDPTAEEAARSLGAGRARVFARVTLPALRPSLAAASLLVALYVLSDFGVVSLMGYSTLTTGIYVRYESLLALESAAILALVLVALALAIVLVASRFRLRGAIYRSTPGAGRRRGSCGSALALARARVLLRGRRPVPRPPRRRPRMVDGERETRSPGGRAWSWSAALDSASLATAAAVVAALVVLPAALLAWRYPSALSRWLERLTLLPSALPGIAVALALVFFGRAHRLARLPEPRAAPLRVRHPLHAVRARLDAVPRSTQSAHASRRPRARSAGGRSARRSAVVLPLARSGVLAGAALVFLSTMKELPATLLLKPIGFETLATEIWSRHRDRRVLGGRAVRRSSSSPSPLRSSTSSPGGTPGSWARPS